jgi:formamidopyrimidine-DNA glycosylase
MHFGMTGWLHIKNDLSAHYKSGKLASLDWPPKYWKFTIITLAEPDKPVAEAAFVDARRFARIRLINCPGELIRNFTPLKENGPDPVIDREILTRDWLAAKCTSKRIPIKALLLDQANISGIG